ncbi:MAG: methionine--tRNA ligase [Planctomycetota bacterium]|jgi:methionyl-tRNA synthetase
MNGTHLVTTTIPYVNAKPHIGFALELVQADVLARTHRLLGRPVHFQTGTDENAFKNVIAARAQGVSTRALVDRNAAAFRALAEGLNVSIDDFIRTTEERHRIGVHAFWKRLDPGDLFRKAYTGLYCQGCEDFLAEKDLVEGLCPDHGAAPERVFEENVFFRLSKYQDTVERLLAEGEIEIVPEKRKTEVLRFIRGGLRDISVSRAAGRAGGWGIPVPGDEDQVIYVWIDALVNYLSAPGFGSRPEWTEVWSADTVKTHVIGKNVWKFHAVYWPALLLSAGLPLPDRIWVHGFLTEKGKRISKTRGSAIDPFRCVAAFGADAVRYALLRAVSPFEDGDFSVERLQALYNADLANGLGNLVSRVTALCGRAGSVVFDSPAESKAPPGLHEALRTFAFDRALQILWEGVAEVNRDIERTKPWERLREGGDIRPVLNRWLHGLDALASGLQPFLPGTAAKVGAALRAKPIVPCAPLFPRKTAMTPSPEVSS